jgi:multiple sugar transport system substrate-binding protein
MKKLIAMVTATVMALTMLGGCAKTSSSVSSSSSSATSSPVTITYAVWDANEAKGLEVMAKEFTAQNPDINVKVQVSSWADYWTVLQAAATGGSLPDTFWMHSNYIYKYATGGMLMDQTKLITSSKLVSLSNYPSGLDSIYNINGKQYCVPKDYDTIGLWYNKTMFDKAGIKYPDDTWTWDTLLNAAKKLTIKNASGKTTQYGILAPMNDQEGFYNFIFQNGGSVIDTKNGVKTSGFSDPKTVEAMQYYVNLVKDGYSQQEYGDATRQVDFENGLDAMAFFGSWNLSGFESNDYMTKNCDVSVLPSGPSGTRASIYNGLGNAIAYNTKYPQQAWKWVEYLSSKAGMLRSAQLGVAIPAYNGTSDAWVSSNKTFNLKIFPEQIQYGVILPYSNTTGIWENQNYEQLKGAFDGTKSVQQACSDATTSMNQSLAIE